MYSLGDVNIKVVIFISTFMSLWIENNIIIEDLQILSILDLWRNDWLEGCAFDSRRVQKTFCYQPLKKHIGPSPLFALIWYMSNQQSFYYVHGWHPRPFATLWLVE